MNTLPTQISSAQTLKRRAPAASPARSGQSPQSTSGKRAISDEFFRSAGKKISATGFKLAAKITAGAVAGGGILAFAGYGMFMAAPHIGALFGTIAAAPATIPILATIGAVLGAVALVVVMRAIYTSMQAYNEKRGW